MIEQKLTFRFEDVETDQATRYARSLSEALNDISEPNFKVLVQRDNAEAQDFGATLVLILGTAAAKAVAEGVKLWLTRNSGAKITVFKDGTVIAEHLDSKDAAKIEEAFSSSK